jgi:hypothetical protein
MTIFSIFYLRNFALIFVRIEKIREILMKKTPFRLAPIETASFCGIVFLMRPQKI